MTIVKALRFDYERETKNTIRFAEDAPEGEALIGILYIQKRAFDGPRPDALSVTIDETS